MSDNPWRILFDIPRAIIDIVDSRGRVIVVGFWFFIFACLVLHGLHSALPALLAWAKASAAHQEVGAQVDAVHQLVATIVMIPVVVITCVPVFWVVATRYPHSNWPVLAALAVVLVLLALLDRWIKRQPLEIKKGDIAAFCRLTGNKNLFTLRKNFRPASPTSRRGTKMFRQ